MRVLLAEDEPDIRDLIAEELIALEIEVVSVSDGSEAWNILVKDARFDYVIADQMMPHLSGIELAQRILTIGPNKPKIILITGVNEFAKAAVSAMGIRAVIEKPIDFKLLQSILFGN